MTSARYPVRNLGLFAAAPVARTAGRPVALIPWPQMAFEVMGPYADPRLPGWGRFPRLPAGARGPGDARSPRPGRR